MQRLDFNDIRAMKGNGSSMRMVLKYFLDKGAEVYLVFEQTDPVERYFLVKYEGLEIPLRANKLNFFSIYNSLLAQTITIDKFKTDSLLQAFNIPTPATKTYENTTGDQEFLVTHATIVVKPRKGAHGDGIATNVQTAEALKAAAAVAKTIHSEVLLQQQISGDDFRLLFLDGKLTAAVKRIPASVTGNGSSPIRELLDQRNEAMAQLWADIREGKVSDEDLRGSVSQTPINEVVAAFGEAFLDTVPAEGETVAVLHKANVSLGGQTEDVTEQVHPELAVLLERLLKHINLPLCGVDVLSSDISAAPETQTSYVIELNAAPGLRLHELPSIGQPRPVCAQVAESLINYYRAIA